MGKKGVWGKPEQTQGSQQFSDPWLVLPQFYCENFHPFYYICLATLPRDLPHRGVGNTVLHYIQ